LYTAEIGIRGEHLSLGLGGLAAGLGVVQLHQELIFFDVVTFAYEQLFYRGGDGGMGLEVLHGLDFAVGGDDAPNGAALRGHSPHWDGGVARQGREQHHGCSDRDYRGDPAVPGYKARLIARHSALSQAALSQACKGVNTLNGITCGLWNL